MVIIELTTNSHKVKAKRNKTKIPIMPPMKEEIPWGFYDDASQGHPPMCGVSVVLFLKKQLEVEFLALWELMYVASYVRVRNYKSSYIPR